MVPKMYQAQDSGRGLSRRFFAFLRTNPATEPLGRRAHGFSLFYREKVEVRFQTNQKGTQTTWHRAQKSLFTCKGSSGRKFALKPPGSREPGAVHTACLAAWAGRSHRDLPGRVLPPPPGAGTPTGLPLSLGPSHLPAALPS